MPTHLLHTQNTGRKHVHISVMKLLLVSLLVLLGMAKGFFLAPPPTKPLQRVCSTAGAMLGSLTHPLANRKVQFSDNEDE